MAKEILLDGMRQCNYQNPKTTKIMLFDLVTGGHHGSYIQYILNYIYQESLDVYIDIVVAPNFFDVHRDTVESVPSEYHDKIKFIPITYKEYSALKSEKSTWKRIWGEWKILCKYAEKLATQHILLMMFDAFQLPLSLAFSAPCLISGIYFRPTFHYDKFPHYSSSLPEKIKQIRQKLILKTVLRHPQIKNIFCLDEFAVPDIRKISQATRIFYLPDPVKTYGNEEITRIKQVGIERARSLNIQANRTVFLLFGYLDKRKGIYQVLEAIRLLPESVAEKICLLLVGEIALDEREKIMSEIRELKTSSPSQIITHSEFIPEEEVSAYFQIADIILTPHQQHIGMSGTILLAAAAQKPVLATNYALVGHLVKINQLGIVLDTQSPQAIADGIIKFMETDRTKLYDSQKMQKFAEQHTYIEFSQTLISNLLSN